MDSFYGYGCLARIPSSGGSEARARAAKVSIIRFTQSIYTAVNGGSFKMKEPKNTINIATMFTVS